MASPFGIRKASKVTIIMTAGDAAKAVQLGFPAYGVSVSNLTSQWLQVGSSPPNWVPPKSRAMFSLNGDQTGNAQWSAPPGNTQPAAITGQQAFCTFTSEDLPDIGAASTNSPYYDRNATMQALSFWNKNVAPHGVTVRWSYNVPTGRKAYLESLQCAVMAEAQGDLAVTPVAGYARSFIHYTAAGGSPAVDLILAVIQDKVNPRSWGTGLFGASMVLSAGDSIVGETENTYTATNCTHILDAKLTEFDA